MRRDVVRTLLVVAEQPYLWAAVRDLVPPELALVRHARPADLASAWQQADPWPWLVVGGAGEVPIDLKELAKELPVPVWWLAEPRGELPPGSVVVSGWSGLEARLQELSQPVLGLEYAPLRGLRTPAGYLMRGTADVEGLMAAYPRALPRFRTLRRARQAMQRAGAACGLSVIGGVVRLEPARERTRGGPW